jgi:hypothetical protein
MRRFNNGGGARGRGRNGAASKSGMSAVRQDQPAARTAAWETSFAVEAGRKFENSIVVRGTEFLTAVFNGPAPAAGQAFINIPVSPAEFSGTRLELFARMYEKYLFTKMSFEYVPSVAYDKAGSIILAYDRDPSDATPPAGDPGIRTYTAWANTRITDVKQRAECVCPLLQPDTGYYVNDAPGGDERLSYQGQFYVATCIPAEVNSVLGVLLFHYECHMWVPNLEVQAPIDFLSRQNVNGATPSPTSPGDALYPFDTSVSAQAPDIEVSASSDTTYAPKLQSAGAVERAIRLSEGVYRMTGTFDMDPTGTEEIEVNLPTLTALQPKPVPGPQPQVQSIIPLVEVIDATNHDPLNFDFLLNVPSGGADLSWRLGLQGGATGLFPNNPVISIEKQSRGYLAAGLAQYALLT